MSHVDEGTLHAYLDGELSAADRGELERHLSVCVPCRNALAEAQGFLAESDQLVQALDLPGTEVAVASSAVAPRRRFRLAPIAWAASVLVAVGLGYSIRNTPAPLVPSPAPVATATVPSQPVVTPTAPAQKSGTTRSDSRQGESYSYRQSPVPPSAGRADQAEHAAEVSPTALASNAGAGVAAPTTEPASPEPAPAQPRALRDATPSKVAMVDGVPVDTTLSRRAFGPANPPAPRRITMDEAVNHLGGTIRLIDGLAPQRVELLAGVDVPGADPSREVVRIYYEEPDLGLVTLDQQRPGPSFDSRRLQSQIDGDSVSASPSTLAFSQSAPRIQGGPALASLSWRNDGTWMSLTSRLTKDQMASLQARVK